MAQTIEPKVAAVAGRRIIERPRLLKLLEESTARTILLIAPAGYGKTTLAQQWAQRCDAAWYPVRLASSDLPVMARGISDALTHSFPVSSRQLEAALSASSVPNDQARRAAQAILDHVETIDGWLVIDDYHLLPPNGASDHLVRALEQSGKLRLLLASRQLPSWATTRRLIYGEIAEVSKDHLALDDNEVTEVLAGRNVEKGFRDQAHGWPAAIGLAQFVSATALQRPAVVADTLYDYFADELYGQASPEVQEQLAKIALMPPLSRKQVGEILGHETLRQTLATGLVHQTEKSIEIHPLARHFVRSKVRNRGDAGVLTRSSIEFSLAHGYWDEAFDLIREFDLHEYLVRLITASFAPLLEAGRGATLEAFGHYAADHSGVPQNLLDLIDAEVALRDGSFGRAKTLGIGSALGMPSSHPLKARGYLIAGVAAQLNYELDEAYALHTRALRTARRPRDVNDAAWGRCVAALYLDDHRLRGAVRELEALVDARAEDRIRIFIGRQHLARLADGLYELHGEAAVAQTLLESISDPWVRTGWGNTYGYSLMLQAHYEEARDVLTASLNEIEAFGLAFGRPHIEWSLAAAELGLRRFSRVEYLLRRVEQHAANRSEFHLRLNARVLRARMYLAQQRTAEAIELTSANFQTFPTSAMYGEYLATRALSLAAAERRESANATARRAEKLTQCVEARVLCAGVRAITAIGGRHGASSAEKLLTTAVTLRAWDGVVHAIRACPELLNELCKTERYQPELRRLLVRSRDVSLAKRAGVDITWRASRAGTLSPRELEVLELLRTGLKNHEIAAALYISVATVKVHVRHILEKLGARSRADAVSRYPEIATAGPRATAAESDGAAS